MLCDVNYFVIPFVATVGFLVLVLCMFIVLVAAIGGLPTADFVFGVVLLGTFGTYDAYYSDFELNFIFSVSIPILFIFFMSWSET